MSYTVSDTVLRTETQWITLRASSSFPLTCLLPPSFHFPFTHTFLSLSVSTSSLSLSLSRSPLISRRCSVTIRPFVRLCRSRSAGFDIYRRFCYCKWWTLEQRQMWEIQSGIPGAATVRNRGDKSQGERKQRRGAWVWFGKWLLFPGVIRLWSSALYHWLHCQARFLSSLPLTLLLLPIQRFPLCQHIGTSLRKRSVNNEVPPLFASLSPLWEHAAAP